jgi:(p)ppGpp synthase/HD superfamily hydrolase
VNRLELAIKWAVDAHADQVDKAGIPYILHPLRVMERVRVKSGGNPPYDLLIAAVLHDVVEDTPITLDYIRENFGTRVAEIVDCLTRRRDPDETYAEFIARCGQDPAAALVKDCDLDDNLDRIEQLPPKEQDIAKRYNKAKIALRGKF